VTATATAPGNSQQPNSGITAKVVRGSSYATVGQMAVLATALVATPFTLRLLAPERYGVLSLISLLIGYILVADLGMGAASTRFAAEAIGQGDARKEVAVLWTSLLVASVPALLGAATFFAFGRQIVVDLLKLAPTVQAEAISALRLAAFVFLLRTASGIFNTPQLSHLRLGTYTVISTTSAVLQSALTPVVLKFGGDVPAVVRMAVGINVAMLLAHIAVDLNILPQMRRPLIRLSLAKPMVLYGGGVIANGVAEVLFAHFDKLAVTRYVSVRDLAFYSIAAAVAGMIAPIPLALYQALVPAFSRMEAAGDRIGCELLLQRSMKILLLPAMLVLMVILVGANPFLKLWAGPEFALRASRTAYILAAGQVVSIFGYAPAAILLAKARSGSIARVRWCELPIYLAAVLLVTQHFGALGAAACWSIRFAIDTCLIIWLALSAMGARSTPIRSFRLREVALLVFIVFVPVLAKLMGATVILQLILAGAAVIVYAVTAWKVFLAADERRWLTRFLGAGRLTQADGTAA
jgi:O-antigen/teichoic acid export membrane protein